MYFSDHLKLCFWIVEHVVYRYFASRKNFIAVFWIQTFSSTDQQPPSSSILTDPTCLWYFIFFCRGFSVPDLSNCCPDTTTDFISHPFYKQGWITHTAYSQVSQFFGMWWVWDERSCRLFHSGHHLPHSEEPVWVGIMVLPLLFVLQPSSAHFNYCWVGLSW